MAEKDAVWKAPAEIKLLSGGNPQIPKGDGDAPVQAYIAAMPDWKRSVGQRIDALVERNVPDVRKRMRWNTPLYGTEGNGVFLGFHCFTRYVKLSFFNGAKLDPEPPERAKDPNTRHFHIHQGEEIDERQIAEWVRQASTLPAWML